MNVCNTSINLLKAMNYLSKICATKQKIYPAEKKKIKEFFSIISVLVGREGGRFHSFAMVYLDRLVNDRFDSLL